MSEEALPSLLSSTMNDWFSPAVLFLFLNLMIASIAISSELSSSSSSDHETTEVTEQNHHHRHHQQGEEEQDPSNSSCFELPKEPIPGSPSVLERIEPSDFRTSTADKREPELEQETEEINDESYGEVYMNINASSARKIMPEKEAAPPSTRSSWSMNSDSGKYQQCEGSGGGGGGGELEEDAVVEDDEGVDARADDFINRFKQQLKLQRLESLSRYRVMVG